MYQFEDSLENISYTIKQDLEKSSKKLRRLKVKANVKSVIVSVILVGGITITILFPNPITAAVAIGATTVLSGSEGLRHTCYKI